MKTLITSKLRISALIAVMLILTLALSSCENTVTVMENGNYKVSANVYKYWLSVYKSYFLYASGIKDTEEGWKSEFSEGMTLEEYATQIVIENVKRNLAGEKMFDDYKLKLSSDAVSSIEDDIAEKIEYYDGRAGLNAALANLGINVDMLKEIYTNEAKVTALYNYLYGDNGVQNVAAEEYAKYFSDNYVHIKYMIIYTDSYVVLDENGDYKYNSNGEVSTEKFTEEEKKQITEKIEQAYSDAVSGADFDMLVKNCSDVDMSEYENGFFLSATDNSAHESDVADAAVSMNVGDVVKISNDYATYIIKKYELPEFDKLTESDLLQIKDFLSYANQDFFLSKLSEAAKDIVLYEDRLAECRISEVVSNSQL